MIDKSNYGFHVPLRQTILIKDVWLASFIYLQRKKKKEKKNVHFSIMWYMFICTDLGLFVVRAYLITMMEKRKENANHIVLYSVNIYMLMYALLQSITHFFLPCFHYSRVHQEYRVDQQHQAVPEIHFDHQ